MFSSAHAESGHYRQAITARLQGLRSAPVVCRAQDADAPRRRSSAARLLARSRTPLPAETPATPSVRARPDCHHLQRRDAELADWNDVTKRLTFGQPTPWRELSFGGMRSGEPSRHVLSPAQRVAARTIRPLEARFGRASVDGGDRVAGGTTRRSRKRSDGGAVSVDQARSASMPHCREAEARSAATGSR